MSASYSRFQGLSTASGITIDAVSGDRIGLVLLVFGAPERSEDVPGFLYRQFTDPVQQRWHFPAGALWRPSYSKIRAARTAARVGDRYRQIGGGAALNLLTREQAASLRSAVARQIPVGSNIEIRSYVAARYGNPNVYQTMKQMVRDGVTKVVLVPLFPQYSAATTGSSVAFWHDRRQYLAHPDWPTAVVQDYSGLEGLVRAMNDRIDQALQRFPSEKRDDVHTVFVARGDLKSRLYISADPYCCQLHVTMQQVMKSRSRQSSYSLAFLNTGRSRGRLGPSVRSHLVELATAGQTSVLAVPTDYVSDQFDTAYNLDIALRPYARSVGIKEYHVMSGVNCHPSFINGISHIVLSLLGFGSHEGEYTEIGHGVFASQGRESICPGPDLVLNGRKGLHRCRECPHARHDGGTAPSLGRSETSKGVRATNV